MDLMRNGVTTTELLQAQAHIWKQTVTFVNSASLKSAVQLGIPDVVHRHGKPMTLTELIASLPINQHKSRCLYRLMRVLVHSGFFVQEKVVIRETNQEEEGYSLTPAFPLIILKDEPLNARALLLLLLDPIITKPFEVLGEWFGNDDRTPFDTAHGRGIWEYTAEDPGLRNVFYEAMAGDSRLIAKVLMMKECKGVFGGLASMVDVGGGTGAVSREIAKSFPKMKCTVFDLPHVVANLEGTTGNLDFVGGDMFVAIPPANAVLLKWIMHDWNDEECVKILKKCKEAINPSKDMGGKVIIIDMVIPNQKTDHDESYEAQIFFDMLVMVTYNGKERNEKEWAELFSAAGFTSYKISPLGLRSIIEVYP